ncbi:hypothetical protein SEVIR_9G059200v4 [Setaria viridis]
MVLHVARASMRFTDADAGPSMRMWLTGPQPALLPGRLPPTHLRCSSRGGRHPATGDGLYEDTIVPPSPWPGMPPRRHRCPAGRQATATCRTRFSNQVLVQRFGIMVCRAEKISGPWF